MRCPKCGYISFDHLESCKKCHKFLGDLTAELNGTAHDAPPPLFLSIASADTKSPPSPSEKQFRESAPSPLFEDDGDESVESSDITFALDQQFELTPQQDETDLAMDLDDIVEVSAKEELDLDFDGPSSPTKEAELPPAPSLDFGDLDISDLAPPEQQQEPIRFEEPETLSDLEPVAALSPTPPPAPPASPQGQSSLEDLNFNGLDLDTPSKLVSGSAAGKRFLPSVKTGTALDKFDIDLGDLFANDRK